MKERYNTILLKNSEVAGQIPQVSDLMPGELAINVADGKLYTLKLTDGQYEVIELAGPVTGSDPGGGGTTSPSIQNLIWDLASGNSSVERYPAYGYYDYSHNMFIIRPEELDSNPMIITGLQVELAGYTSGYTYYNQTIKLAHTTDLEFGDNVQVDLTNISGVSDLTSVKESFDWVIGSSGYQTIDFDTNFEWNGQDSILIIHENRDGAWGSGFGYAKCHFDNTFYSSWYKHQDDTYPTGYGTKDQSYRPNFKLKY